MCRIKEGERCMACHLELRTQGVSATRAQPAKIKVNMDSGVLQSGDRRGSAGIDAAAALKAGP
jgi:hypothetical protein